MPRPDEIRAEFYQGEVVTELQEYDVARVLLEQLANHPNLSGSNPIRIGAHVFDVRRILPHSAGYISGEFVKFRREVLPNVGALTRDERELDIQSDEYLVEKNYFLYEMDRRLLVYQKNGHAGSVLNFEQYLTRAFGKGKIGFHPVLQPDPMKRLLRGEAMPRKLHLSAARPTNPELIQTSWGKAAMELLSSSGGIGFSLQLRADGYSKKEDRYLMSDIKRAVAELVECGAAKTAKIEIEEDGFSHPIDLIADRLISIQKVEMGGRYPLRSSIIPALEAALEEKARDLELIFGTAGNRLV